MMYNLSDQTTLNGINALVYQIRMVWVVEERVAEMKGLLGFFNSLLRDEYLACVVAAVLAK